MKEVEFTLIPSDEIPRKRHSTLYTRIVEGFRQQEHDTVEVSVPGVSYDSLYPGLRRAVEAMGVDDVRRFGRNNVVYLTKNK